MTKLPMAIFATAAFLAVPAASVGQAQDTRDTEALPSLAELDEGWNTLKPGGETTCAHGTDYEFYARAGDPAHLLVYLYGGGACWNAELCEQGDPYYASEITPALHPSQRGGILDPTHPDNPFGDYTMVGIPVCTGDVHLGDRDAVYTLEREDGERTEFTIHHRGLTNVLSAIDWVTSHVESPERIFVGGGSAGGVGLPFHASLLARTYPDAAVTGLGDSASSYGVDALSMVDAERWGVPGVLHGYPGWETVGFTSIVELSVTGGRGADNLSLYQIDPGRDEVQRAWLWLITGESEPDVLGNIEDNQSEIRTELHGFRSFILGGAHHVILQNPVLFYRAHADGHSVRDWVAALADGAPVTDVRCDDCDRAGFTYDDDDLAIVNATIELLTDSGWSPDDQGGPCPEGSGALSLRCAVVAAVDQVSGAPPWMHAAVWEIDNEAVVRTGEAAREGILHYNNDPERTVEEVLDMLEEVRERIRADPWAAVRAAQTAMAEAMAAAECDRVAELIADEFTFYAGGRHLDSHETVIGRCRQVPRPFPEGRHVVDEVRVLSETSALALQVLEFQRDEPDRVRRREVITRLWIRGDDGRWRIQHMHVSLDEVPDR
jgi:acetyl esterase/lipase